MHPRIHVRSRDELIRLVQDHIKRDGPACDLNHLDVSGVTDFHKVFESTAFNGDVSNATTLFGLFSRTPFNGDISRWDVSGLKDAVSMFYLSPFNGDISGWDLRETKTGMMLDTVHFQTPLPKLPLRCSVPVINASYKGDSRSLVNIEHASSVFGSKKHLDMHLGATIGGGLNHLHIERIVQLSSKPSWCSKADFQEAKAVASMCSSMGIDKTQWSSHAYRSYCARRETATAHDALADFSFDCVP